MSKAVGGRLPWARIVAEGCAIVVSILLAFGIDAWWESRQQRAAELDALRAIREEFQANEELLSHVHEMHGAALKASDALLVLVQTTPDQLPAADSLESLLQSVRNNWTYDPVDGALNSLLDAGDLGLVSNPVLRARLAAWPDLVRDLNEDEMIQRGEVQERLTPYLAERLPLRGLFRPELGPAASRADFERLFGELQFANLIEVRRRFAENILVELQVLRETVDNILSLIHEEIG